MAEGKKTGGRKKGSVNRVTKEVKDVISTVIGEYANGIEIKKGKHISLSSDLSEVDAYQRLQIFAKLTDYVLPKQKSVEHKNNTFNGVFRIGYGDSATSTWD